MAQPRVVVLTDTFYPIVGGGETHARILSNKLNEQGICSFVITGRTSSSLAQHEVIDSIPVNRVGLPDRKRLGKYLAMVPAFIKLYQTRRAYDVIYVCGLRTLGVVGVLAAKAFEKVCVLRSESCGELDGSFIANHQAKSAVVKILAQLYVRSRNAILRLADAYVCISEAIEDEYRRCGVLESKLTRIPNGLDVTHFVPADEKRRKLLRTQLDLPRESTIWCYSGKLNKGKGLDVLLRAWRRVVEHHVDAHLVLIGAGDNQILSQENEIRNYIKAHGLEEAVTITGYVDNVSDYLRAANFFILPSESEGLPLSLIEAMSCGLTCAATRISGVLDVLSDGIDGHLMEPGNEDSIYRTIVARMRDTADSERMGKAARRTAVERFDIARVASDHARLFRRMIGERSVAG